MTVEERSLLIEEARTSALNQMADSEALDRVVAHFYGALHGKIDPPLHHADVTQGILLAEAHDAEAVRNWLEKF